MIYLFKMRYWVDKVKIVIKHNYNQAYCVNIKIEDKMLKYIIYPKQ